MLNARENKGLLLTSLPSAGAVCEKETFQLMKTRNARVDDYVVRLCSQGTLSSICDARKCSQHICKPSDRFASW